jgi:PIN domain nuclease of toxin-antitoxin system
MNILLDTCAFLWMIDDVGQLGPQIRPALENSENRVILHQASMWEIQIKYDLGKLPLARLPREIISDGIQAHIVEYCPLQNEDIWHLHKLPPNPPRPLRPHPHRSCPLPRPAPGQPGPAHRPVSGASHLVNPYLELRGSGSVFLIADL